MGVEDISVAGTAGVTLGTDDDVTSTVGLAGAGEHANRTIERIHPPETKGKMCFIWFAFIYLRTSASVVDFGSAHRYTCILLAASFPPPTLTKLFGSNPATPD